MFGTSPTFQPTPSSPPSSHEAAPVCVQRPLEAHRRVIAPTALGQDAAQQLFEEQDDVPVVSGRALHVAALPGLLHEQGEGPAGRETLSLQVPFVPHYDDGRFADVACPRKEGTRRRFRFGGPQLVRATVRQCFVAWAHERSRFSQVHF